MADDKFEDCAYEELGTVCKFCEPAKNEKGVNYCRETFDGYSCTRERGHHGQHVACGTFEHVMVHWHTIVQAHDGGLKPKEVNELPS